MPEVIYTVDNCDGRLKGFYSHEGALKALIGLYADYFDRLDAESMDKEDLVTTLNLAATDLRNAIENNYIEDVGYIAPIEIED